MKVRVITLPYFAFPQIVWNRQMRYLAFAFGAVLVFDYATIRALKDKP